MTRIWMVRAGEGGYLVEEFQKEGVVGIGWDALGDMTPLEDREQIQNQLVAAYPDDKSAVKGVITGMLYRFRHEMQKGDTVITV